MVYGHCYSGSGRGALLYYVKVNATDKQERIGMRRKGSQKAAGKQTTHPNQTVVEEVIENKLSDITTILYSTNGGKSRLHEDILSMVERSLFKIALQRNNNIKGQAAAYLGINRNTFQKKMVKFGMDNSKE